MKIVKTLLIGIVLISSFGCNKYESGPFFSLISKTNRISQSWDYSAVYRNGLDVTNGIDTSGHNYLQSSIGFADDSRFSYFDVINNVEYRGDGFWELIDNDNKLQLIYEDIDSTVRTFRITRLENRFLWLEEELDNSTTLEFQLIPHI